MYGDERFVRHASRLSYSVSRRALAPSFIPGAIQPLKIMKRYQQEAQSWSRGATVQKCAENEKLEV